jgi:cell wall-associated NlpC family hydrolase
VSATTNSPRSLGRRAGVPRHYSLAAGLVALAVVAAVVALTVGGSSHHPQSLAQNLANQAATRAQQPPAGSARHATSRAPAVSHPAKASSGVHGGAPVSAAEARDPEEARSFPVSGAVRYKTAATPSTAADEEFHPSPGAASNAEVKRELGAEEKAQAEERTSAAGASAAAVGKAGTPVPGGESIGGNGELPIPSGVPEVVQKVVAGANAIADFPYVYGGGHASFVDNAYDCSGSVSYALAAGGLIGAPETSGELESWGVPGPGRYITVYANAGHTYMYVDGVLYDTAGRSGPYASRWQFGGTDNEGYVVRHWPGL